ncbi:MAG: hypothetical protein E3J54_05835 [Actinobacteria bacterium]|nr:MAG: hypothetical protein E3J54_05835 [Actinomycetota bacterium]
MEKKQTNYQIYERIWALMKTKKPWSKDYVRLIENLEKEPGYPMDDPKIFDLIKFALDEIKMIKPHVTKRVDLIGHILEIDFQTFDRFHYDLLGAYLYDLSDHLYGFQEPHVEEDELKSTKVKAVARLLESLAAICINNAQIN